MNSTPKCLECGLEQCRRIYRLVRGDDDGWEQVQQELAVLVPALDLSEPPGTMTAKLLVRTTGLLGTTDPFREIKQEQNRQAAELAVTLDGQLGRDEAGLRRAMMLAAAGNVLDVGPGQKFDLNTLLDSLRFAHDDSEKLIERLRRVRRVMYILDNCGEVMFDRLVLSRLPRTELTIVARSSPILNDVTVEEAVALGLGEFGRLIGTGSPYLGIDFQTVSPEFRAAYEQAELVIAKGHANFEALVDGPRDGFYLLTAKCELVADRLGVGLGQSVCYYSAGAGR
ncbi:MAG: ARMT1-like domain-containing protein [candidate division WOR-3 bacterium]